MSLPAWVELLYHALETNIPKDFVGQIEVNVFKGGITNINVKQSYKSNQEGHDHESTQKQVHRESTPHASNQRTR